MEAWPQTATSYLRLDWKISKPGNVLINLTDASSSFVRNGKHCGRIWKIFLSGKYAVLPLESRFCLRATGSSDQRARRGLYRSRAVFQDGCIGNFSHKAVEWIHSFDKIEEVAYKESRCSKVGLNPFSIFYFPFSRLNKWQKPDHSRKK